MPSSRPKTANVHAKKAQRLHQIQRYPLGELLLKHTPFIQPSRYRLRICMRIARKQRASGPVTKTCCVTTSKTMHRSFRIHTRRHLATHVDCANASTHNDKSSNATNRVDHQRRLAATTFARKTYRLYSEKNWRKQWCNSTIPASSPWTVNSTTENDGCPSIRVNFT